MAVNISLPFSESAGGEPIRIGAGSVPGTKIHDSINEKDFVWLYLSLTSYVPYNQMVNVAIVKGFLGGTYSIDSVILVPGGTKVLVENGLLLTNYASLHAYIDASSSTLTTVAVSASGWVHRRLE